MEWLFVKEPLTKEQVNEIINGMGIKLPEDFISFIGPVNGGALRNATIYVPNLGETPYSRNVSLSKKMKNNAISLYTYFKSLNIPLFPFGSVGDGDYFCFHLPENEIVLYQHETQRYKKVCDTFCDLMEMLGDK